jgi:hypothetical protein
MTTNRSGAKVGIECAAAIESFEKGKIEVIEYEDLIDNARA